MTKGKSNSSKPSDVLSRMKAAASREKPASTLPELAAEDAPPHLQAQAKPQQQAAPVVPSLAPEVASPTRTRRVRFTLDLDPEAHKRLKRFALEADADASEVMRALLGLLDTDASTRNAVLSAVAQDMP